MNAVNKDRIHYKNERLLPGFKNKSVEFGKFKLMANEILFPHARCMLNFNIRRT